MAPGPRRIPDRVRGMGNDGLAGVVAALNRLLGGPGPGGVNLAAVIRHSARESMGEVREHHHLLLTDEGRKHAFDLGLRFPPGRPIRIFHSPVPRCRETAEEAREGASAAGRAATVAGARGFLGDPFLDFSRALDLIRSLGVSRFSRLWLDGGVDSRVIRPAEGVFQELTTGVVSALMEEPWPHIDLHVAHDWNVLLLRERLLGLRHEDVGWPAFLDGVVLSYREGRLTAAYRDTTCTVDWPRRKG